MEKWLIELLRIWDINQTKAETNLDQGKRPRGARGFRDVGDTDRVRIQAAAVAIESRQQRRERQK